MKLVKLWGGVGNQMFQYSFALYLEKVFNEKTGFYAIPASTKDTSVAIKAFAGDLRIIPYDNIRHYLGALGNGISYRAERKALVFFPWLNNNIFIEPRLNFIRDIPIRATLYDGYWQSYKYIDPVAGEIRRRIRPEKFHPGNDVLLERIKESNSVSVHVRRGDYLNRRQRKIYAVCAGAYYSKAIDVFREKTTDPEFFVFSDEPDEARMLFLGRNERMTFVDYKDSGESWLRDMCLMSTCRHNIIANSTFSWWAAWLNHNPGKIVIAPQNWYNGKLNEVTRELIPEEWIRL